MAKSHHMSRKEMNDDAFKNAGVSIYEYIQEHAHQFLTGVLSVALVFCLVIAVNKYRAAGAEKAADQLNAVQKQYLNALGTTDTAARTAALEDVASLCDGVIRSHGSSEVGHEALFIKGNTLYLKESYDEAIKVFEELRSKASNNDDRGKALVAIGYCYEDQAFAKQNDKELLGKAKTAFEDAAKVAGNLTGGKGSYQKYQAQLGVVRAEIALGNLAEAKKLAEAVKLEREAVQGKEKKFKESDYANYPTMNRADKARLIRQGLAEKRAGMNFEKRAERDLEEIESRLKMPAGAVAASLPIITADVPTTKTVSAK
ncbi:TPA: hypothetical protein DDW35_08550 [Candidatus Sumerlaeota bacterium]|jgi:tetratricopeptide (TPR) repeat protein|nr:hypothetical protein [Candidatus Sumerlaeota bacterium]